jgi:hypothetical protein
MYGELFAFHVIEHRSLTSDHDEHRELQVLFLTYTLNLKSEHRFLEKGLYLHDAQAYK